MKDFAAKLFLKWFGMDYVRRLLNLIPLRGKMTVLCAIATAVAVLKSAYNYQAFDAVLAILKDQGAIALFTNDQIQMIVGAMAVLLFAFRHVLNQLSASREDKEH